MDVGVDSISVLFLKNKIQVKDRVGLCIFIRINYKYELVISFYWYFMYFFVAQFKQNTYSVKILEKTFFHL
ncbi:hypothetical protein EFB08_21155 [Rufibacter latericius]|uniref:Uncharacterized protein n=1 Tax=Rufibacter latericius TaxID=2487040 RepID=A0A3M9MAR4_9BACT|nr:hypothetical protein EFB08_21155 [Rufibacter latericius]